jgi:hypothetical protein
VANFSSGRQAIDAGVTASTQWGWPLFASSSQLLGIRHQHADPPRSVRLLRARRHWPRDRRTAKSRDELASLHGRFPNIAQLATKRGGCLACRRWVATIPRAKRLRSDSAEPAGAFAQPRLSREAGIEIEPPEALTAREMPPRLPNRGPLDPSGIKRPTRGVPSRFNSEASVALRVSHVVAVESGFETCVFRCQRAA